jgi:hypothetical protein
MIIAMPDGGSRGYRRASDAALTCVLTLAQSIESG